MRAEVKAVNVRAFSFQQLLQFGVDRQDILLGINAESDAALVGDHDDAEPVAVEQGDSFDGAGQELELVPAGDVLAFGHLAVDHAVTVEEDGVDRAGIKTAKGIVHPAMIAIERLTPACTAVRRTAKARGNMSSSPDAGVIFRKAIEQHIDVVRTLETQLPALEAIARAMLDALRGGGKILWCGNGGSAGDAQHLAAELVGRFSRERRGLASMALTTDTSILTAVANDYGFEAVFSRQVEALGRPGDVLVAMSTSGKSRNVLAAVQAARAQGLVTVAFTGAGGGKLGPLADHLLAVDARVLARVQEAHMLAGHLL